MSVVRLDYIQMAKDLTGSNDIKVIIAAAKEIERYAQVQENPKGLPSDLSSFYPYCKIQHPLHGPIPFEPFDFHNDWGWSLTKYVNEDPKSPLLFCVARQMGLLTVMSAFALWYALSSRRQRVLILGERMSSAHEIKDRLHIMSLSLPNTFGGVRVERNYVSCWNGSKIEFGTPNNAGVAQMEDADLIVIVNAAYISYSRDAAVKAGIDAAMEAKTPVVLASCPMYQQGLFWDYWKRAPERNKVLTKWSQQPHRDEEWANAFRIHLGVDTFRREFECQFDPPRTI